MKAIVGFFRTRMKEGRIEIRAGPPKKRDPFPKIAKNSERLMVDSLEEHKGALHSQLAAQAEQRAKMRSQLYLGSFNEKTIAIY